jgi:dipeptidyl-peptidase-4
LRESSTTGWLNAGIDPRPSPALIPRWLSDGRRFIWESNRNGWTNFYLYDVSGTLLNQISANSADAGAIVKIDEARNVVFYTARDGDNYLKLQLHRVGLDGKGDLRLTNPAFTHSVNVAPDGRHFIDNYQTHDTPPASQLVDATGKVLAQLGASDTTKFDQAGLRKAELFSYQAADGKTPLYGQVSFPSNFDPAKKYPVLLNVYGGPVVPELIPAESCGGPS